MLRRNILKLIVGVAVVPVAAVNALLAKKTVTPGGIDPDGIVQYRNYDLGCYDPGLSPIAERIRQRRVEAVRQFERNCLDCIENRQASLMDYWVDKTSKETHA